MAWCILHVGANGTETDCVVMASNGGLTWGWGSPLRARAAEHLREFASERKARRWGRVELRRDSYVVKRRSLMEESNREVATQRMALAFNEWMRRYTDEPERFAREFKQCGEFLAQIAKGEMPTYGDDCAAYFTSILDGLDAATTAAA